MFHGAVPLVPELCLIEQCSSSVAPRRTRIFVRMPCGEILPADMDLNWTTWQASEYIIATWHVKPSLAWNSLDGGIYELGGFGGFTHRNPIKVCF